MLISVGERLVGYEILEYKEVVLGCASSNEGIAYRQSAIKKLSDNAAKAGANAVINLRMEICSNGTNMQEITAYGDAVLVKEEGSDILLGDVEKPKVELEAYVPKPKSNVITGQIQEVGSYKFVVCPKCGTKYKVETDENGEVHIKGFDDVDDAEPGLQVFCLRCGTKFTVPEH